MDTPLVRNPSNREDGYQRIVNPITRTSKQKKKERMQDLMRSGNLPMSSRQREKVLIRSINYRL